MNFSSLHRHGAATVVVLLDHSVTALVIFIAVRTLVHGALLFVHDYSLAPFARYAAWLSRHQHTRFRLHQPQFPRSLCFGYIDYSTKGYHSYWGLLLVSFTVQVFALLTLGLWEMLEYVGVRVILGYDWFAWILSISLIYSHYISIYIVPWGSIQRVQLQYFSSLYVFQHIDINANLRIIKSWNILNWIS